MTEGKPKGRRSEAAYRDLEDAFQRLLDGRPRNTHLKALAAAKKLQITVKAVAVEAGRSRTLIGSDDCRFPNLRARIIAEGRGKEPVTTVTKLAASVRATNAKLRAEVRALQSQQALMLARMIEAERKAKILERDLAAAGSAAPRDGNAGAPDTGPGNLLRLPTSPRGGNRRQ